MAQACEASQDAAGARAAYATAKRLAHAIGVRHLPPEDQQLYFRTIKRLGEQAHAAGDWAGVIENLVIYTEANQSGQDTLRIITEAYEHLGDALAALQWNERAMLYDSRDPVLVERKDRYYYSIAPEQLQAHQEEVRKLFDVSYCIRKAKSLLDLKQGGDEQVEWAMHLAELARVMEPKCIAALTLCARARLRRGEQSDAVPLLEEARAAKGESFASGDDEEAWYIASRLLGDLYLNTLGRPDQALLCYADYRKSTKSGVDTLYKMGQCYEQLGDRQRAARCYENVAAYDHPLAYEANAALSRLGSG
jgi:tetratricopeptide (TPR) repeat protein